MVKTSTVLTKTNAKNALRIAGLLGAFFYGLYFVYHPSFPTPDKILIFLVLVFMSFGQAKELIKRLAPFVLILIVYESLRGLVPSLNKHVHYSFMPSFDIYLFSGLPTKILQNWLWHGAVRWYDFAFFLAYMLHFVLPIGLAILIWKYKTKFYWRYITSYILLSFAGFLTYLIYPAAPPWLASQNGTIEPITRISSFVWERLGIHDFPSIYNRISPNPVAAVPSLHAAYATLLSLFIFKLFGKKWGILFLIYPFLIFAGTVYQGEHYVFDVILGIVYAFAVFAAAKPLLKVINKALLKIKKA